VLPSGWHIEGLADSANLVVVTIFGEETTG
jgi:hypothetical protein